MSSKYIVGRIRMGYADTVVAVVFPDALAHSDVAGAFFEKPERILGAGFCAVTLSGASAYGKSVSLGVDSRPVDGEYLKVALGFQEKVDSDIRRQDNQELSRRDQAASPEAT